MTLLSTCTVRKLDGNSTSERRDPQLPSRYFQPRNELKFSIDHLTGRQLVTETRIELTTNDRDQHGWGPYQEQVVLFLPSNMRGIL